MAKLYNGWLALSILIAIAAQECSGELKLHEATITEAVQGVGRAFDRLADIMNESVSVQMRNSVALSELVSTIARGAQDYKEKNDKNDRKDENISDYIEELKNQLKSQQEKVRLQEEELTECRQKLINLADSEKKLNTTVHYLDRRLVELQKRELELINIRENMNTKAETENGTTALAQDCTQPNLEEIKKMVEEFVRDRDWQRLKPKLLPLLDEDSEAYEQVRRIEVLPMYMIGKDNYIALASLLLCAGMPVNALDNRSHTMLHGAAGGGDLQLAKMLLDLGAYINVKNVKGFTPLMKAAYYDNLEMVKFLLQAGADTRARNNEGLTALDLARKHYEGEVVQYLEKLSH